MRIDKRPKKNSDIRAAIMAAGYRDWQVGVQMDMSASVFSFMLGRDLTEEERERIYQAIRELDEQTGGDRD